MWQQTLADASLVSWIAIAARWRSIDFWPFFLESSLEYHKWMLQLFDLANGKARRQELGASVLRLKALIRRALECYTNGA